MRSRFAFRFVSLFWCSSSFLFTFTFPFSALIITLDNSLYVDYSSSEEEEEETVKVGRGRRARRGSDSGSDVSVVWCAAKKLVKKMLMSLSRVCASLFQYNPSAGSDSDAGKRRSSRAPTRGSRTSARNVRKRYSDDESEESQSDDDFSEVQNPLNPAKRFSIY